MVKEDAASQDSQDERDVVSAKGAVKIYARGIAGGVLFSLPLIYTMEMWWAGFIAPPSYLLACVLATFVLLIGYNRFAGIRRDSTWWDVVTDSAEEMGIAFLAALLLLWLLHRITFETPLLEVVGKVVVEAMVLAIGISVGTAQLGQSAQKESKQEQSEDRPGGGVRGLLRISTLHICGAILVSSSVAPTVEIQELGAEMDAPAILLMVAVSLLISAVILFFSDFKGSGGASQPNSIIDMLLDVTLSYATALLVSFALLLFFGRFEGSFLVAVSQVVVLALPASVGAAAGKILIQ
jgi:putative integral membrane protein (TIGR02587 family)